MPREIVRHRCFWCWATTPADEPCHNCGLTEAEAQAQLIEFKLEELGEED